MCGEFVFVVIIRFGLNVDRKVYCEFLVASNSSERWLEAHVWSYGEFTRYIQNLDNAFPRWDAERESLNSKRSVSWVTKRFLSDIVVFACNQKSRQKEPK